MIDQLPLFLSNALLTTAVSTLPIVFIIYVLTRRLMKEFIDGKERSRYDDAKHEAVLSELRASYEHRIADLNREMVATRARWEDANHLLISGQKNQPTSISNRVIDPHSFLKQFGINPEKVDLNPDRIFVLTPFSPEERPVYEVIKTTCADVGFNVIRGDESRADGDILTQVVWGIVSSGIIIANISSRNPNVFFELGIAMALGKPTLLISDTLSDIPFDLQSRRIIVFKGAADLEKKLHASILQTIRSNRS